MNGSRQAGESLRHERRTDGGVLDHDSPPVRVLRLLFGLLALSTVIVHMSFLAGLPEGLDIVTYFSLFTFEVNPFAGAVLAVSGLWTRDHLPRWWDGIRGAAAVYLLSSLSVYLLLMDGQPSSMPPWIDVVLHRLMPVVVVLDWLLIPSAYRARWWRPLAWIAFPTAFLAYSLIRGPMVNWYPYPFLDPRVPGGYAGLVGSAGAVVLGFLVAALVLDQVGRLRRRLALRRDGRTEGLRGDRVLPSSPG